MKKFRKVFALVIAAVMALAMGIAASAAPQGQGTLTMYNAMKGQTYTAYKIFSAVYTDPAAGQESKGVIYTVPASLEAKVSAPFSVSTAVASNGEKIIALASGTSDEDVLAWAKANYSKFDSTGTTLTYNENGTATATLEYGYYFIKSGLGSMVTIDSLNRAVTVVDKNESKPEGPEKVITAEDSSIISALDKTGISVEENDAAVGSVESFKVTFQATNWVESENDDSVPATSSDYKDDKIKVTSWNLTDTPTGLSIDASTVKITVNGTTIYENGASVDTTNATTVTGGGTSPLTIAIPWTNSTGGSLYATQTQGSEKIPVVVTYNATVTRDAATAVATNSVAVKYNNTEALGSKGTKTYTYKFQIDKTKNEENQYELLPGAKFQLYASDGTTLLKFDQSGTTYTFNAGGSVDTIDMTENATALIQGLDKDGYVLKEIQAPQGYNPAADQTVPANQLVRVDGTITDAANAVTGDTGVATVINEQGAELPSTGGVGTTIFYIIGSILVIGAGVLLVTKKRMDA